MLVLSGMNKGAACHLLHALAERIEHYDTRVESRLRDIPRAIDSAVGKIQAVNLCEHPAASPTSMKLFRSTSATNTTCKSPTPSWPQPPPASSPATRLGSCRSPGRATLKTETVNSVSGVDHTIAVSTIASEGALLSAIPKKGKGAHGGLLRQLGDRGILVIKDFTSIVSGDRKARAQILAALREIHDGRWDRSVGSSGGLTITWTGRIVCIAACTTEWDTAHSVIAAMGPRFVIIRSSSEVGRKAAGKRSIRNTGGESTIRRELSQAVAALIADARLSRSTPH